MTSLEKSLSDQMKQHTEQLEAGRKEKSDITKELQQSNSELQKVQTTSKDFEKKYEVAQESLANLKKDLKNKVWHSISFTKNCNFKIKIIYFKSFVFPCSLSWNCNISNKRPSFWGGVN